MLLEVFTDIDDRQPGTGRITYNTLELLSGRNVDETQARITGIFKEGN